MIIHCADCQHLPHEIPEYVQAAADEGITPEQFVIQEEGTYNSSSGRFWCTDCYFRRNCPSGKAP